MIIFIPLERITNLFLIHKFSPMKNIFLCVCLLWTTSSYAQIQNAIKDSKNTWVAEFTTDIRLDMLYDEQKKQLFDQTKVDVTGGGLDIMKIVEDPKRGNDEAYQTFTNILLNAANNQQLPIYEDKECQLKTNTNVLQRIDTITTIDPTTYETKIRVVYNQINQEDIKLFRVNQIITYQPMQGVWTVQVVSLAPLVIQTNEIGEFQFFKPLFWIKVNNDKVKLSASNITWAVRTRSRSTNSYLDFSKIIEHKKVGLEMPLRHFINKAETDASMPLFSSESWRDKFVLSMEQRKGMINRTDTITQIDPVTYETKDKVLYTKIDVADLKLLRLSQEWAWDNRKKVLSTQLIGVSPMNPVKNEAGEFLFLQPLFIRRFDK